MSKVKIATKKVSDNGTVEFSFANQESRTVELGMFNKDIQAKIIGYGLSQKFGDTYAGCDGDADKAVALFDSAVEKLSGDEATWVTKRAGGAGRGTTLIVEAISRYKDCSTEDAMELLEGLDDSQIKAVRGTPQMQSLLADIKAERAAEKAQEAAKKEGAGEDILSVLDTVGAENDDETDGDDSPE